MTSSFGRRALTNTPSGSMYLTPGQPEQPAPPKRTTSNSTTHHHQHHHNQNHRIAISNQRILNAENGKVTFKWRDYSDSNKQKIMTLSADEFLRRFFMHILPKGFAKIRHFGFLSSRGKQTNLKKCKIQTATTELKRLSTDELLEKILGRKPAVCPDCGCPLIHHKLPPP